MNSTDERPLWDASGFFRCRSCYSPVRGVNLSPGSGTTIYAYGCLECGETSFSPLAEPLRPFDRLARIEHAYHQVERSDYIVVRYDELDWLITEVKRLREGVAP